MHITTINCWHGEMEKKSMVLEGIVKSDVVYRNDTATYEIDTAMGVIQSKSAGTQAVKDAIFIKRNQHIYLDGSLEKNEIMIKYAKIDISNEVNMKGENE